MSREVTKELAKITKASIDIEDHGFLTINLMFEGEGWGCGYGGYVYRTEHDPLTYDGAFAITVHRLMEGFEVGRWSDLVGKIAWVWTEGWGGSITQIQPVRFSGKRADVFRFKDFFPEKDNEA